MLVSLAPLACVSPPPGVDPNLSLARPPAPPQNPGALRIEPARLAIPLGEAASLRVLGSRAQAAHCSSTEGEVTTRPGPTLGIAPVSSPGVVVITCQADEHRASAQLTFTTARVLPLHDPYVGGVVLFKLRRTPDAPQNPVGRQSLGLPTLDALLRLLGAYAFPAFPFDRTGTLDAVGLDRWIVIELPENINYYQAVALLRADRYVLPESYLPEDGGFLRVRATGSWPIALRQPRPGGDAGRPRPRGRASGPAPAPVSASGAAAAGKLGWELEAIGAPLAWAKGWGAGTGVAIVDTGVDTNHVSILGNLRDKPDETPAFDADGNGIPGDRVGINLAHLAIAHGEGAPRLALGLLSNVSDWSDLDASPSRPWGHGTAVAALAAGTGDADGRLGVAPHAWILPVDIQENLRTTQSHLLEEDPRMRLVPRQPAPLSALRSPLWARAAGVAYAVREGVRVLTCAWPPLEPSWILHDVLLYAEDNCVLAVCATRHSPSGSAASTRAYPARWRASAARGQGIVHDAWTGEARADFFERPLRSLLVTAGADTPPSSVAGDEPDLYVPLRSPSGRDVIRSAASDPRNDSAGLLDRRSAPFARPGAAAGFVAGAALLLSARRPDLDPLAVRNALLDGARFERGTARLWVPDALEAAERRPRGRCAEEPEPKPWWEGVRVRATRRQPGQPSPPPGAGIRLP